jgi:hypothetical protein
VADKRERRAPKWLQTNDKRCSSRLKKDDDDGGDANEEEEEQPGESDVTMRPDLKSDERPSL